MEDLFSGFIRNYSSFGIRDDTNWTKWTHKILGFYAQLGRMLGAYVEYEWNSLDLIWFWSLKEKEAGEPWLHVEHENDPDRLKNLLGKIDESEALTIIAIGYPPSTKDSKKFMAKVEDIKREWKDLEILVVLDAEAYEEDPVSITGSICRYGRPTKIIEAKKVHSTDGSLYAYLVDK